MDAPFESSAEEVARLRDCLTDLASIMALPACPRAANQVEIVSTLTDALLGMLGLAFVCVRLNDPEGGPSIETMRIGDTREEQPDPTFPSRPPDWASTVSSASSSRDPGDSIPG